MMIVNEEVFGFNSAIRGMRNPLNSWGLSDSDTIRGDFYYNSDDLNSNIERFEMGEKDLNLAQRLITGGTEHCKFMRQIQVWCELTAPRYFWSEFDTYKIGTSANSTSTMHKLFDKKTEIKLDMFEVHTDFEKSRIENIIEDLNKLREDFFNAKTQQEKNLILTSAKRILPESYLNMRTVNMSYAVIRNIIIQRRHHKLKFEWQDSFCKWVTKLPYSKELIFCGMETEYERLKG